MSFDPEAVCRLLNDEGVDYVVVGGFAATIHGSPLPTLDIDVMPSRTHDNLVRLATALRKMNAQFRTESDPVPAKWDAQFLENMPVVVNLVTDYGIVDLTFAPAGPLNGFDAWNAGAATVEIGVGVAIRIAGLDDIIDSKEAAGRLKDLNALPYLKSLRDIRGEE